MPMFSPDCGVARKTTEPMGDKFELHKRGRYYLSKTPAVVLKPTPAKPEDRSP
jgi:hypothetical protein